MKHAWLMFVAGAVLTWGAYVVTIDHGRAYMAGLKLAGRPLVPPAVAAMRAFLFIGLAYCVLGVVVPLIYMAVNKVDPAQFPQDPRFIGKGVTLSFIAGLLGAAGALCIVFAVGAARRANVSPGAVAALVFCFAPIVNVIISLVIEPPASRPSPLFFLGIILAAAGAGMVLYYKPAPAPHVPAHSPAATKAAGPTPNTTAQAASDAARAVDGAGT
jgi:hypothetical protein